ncbi:MAG: hypothetical protein JWO95_235 [Verrucomicrobiales bacterium]|nr:hypothetical protein [Verrucomicrobiales bacterium]
MKISALCFCASVACLSLQASPRIQFETNFFDFGHLAGVESASGTFKFKNVGDAVLKLDPPRPSCGCTDAKASPDTLAPGESGVISYKINLDHSMVKNEKMIAILSNDPQTPSVTLKAQLAYDPVYQINEKSIRVTVPVGKDEATESLTIARPDNQPLGIDRITTSQEWISGAIDEKQGLINVTIKRSTQVPPHFTGSLKLWNSKCGNVPVRTISVIGEIEGELAASPRGLYWVFAEQGNDLKAYPPTALSKSVQLKSVLGHEVEIKNAKCTIKGTSVEVVPKEGGKLFDLVLKLDEVPHGFVTGKVTLETSLQSMPQMEVPVTISVFKQ